MLRPWCTCERVRVSGAPSIRSCCRAASSPNAEGRDDRVAIDLQVHSPDLELMRRLGVTDAPREHCDLSSEPWFGSFRSRCRDAFTERKLSSNPHSYLLEFESCLGFGPLEVLRHLSQEGAARYTDALLSREAIYEPWTMRHVTVGRYPPLEC